MKILRNLKFEVLQLVVLNKACIPNLGFLLGIEHTFLGVRWTTDGQVLITSSSPVLLELGIKQLSLAGAWPSIDSLTWDLSLITIECQQTGK